MISPRKLASLPPGTRLRKLIRLLLEWEQELGASIPPAVPLGEYLSTVSIGDFGSPAVYDEWLQIVEKAKGLPTSETGAWETQEARSTYLWTLQRLRYFLCREIGADPAEWDFHCHGDQNPPNGPRPCFPIRLYLDELRSPFNVGSLFRTALCFGVEKIYLAPGTALPSHPRAIRSAMGAVDLVPWEILPYGGLEHEPNLFALETDGEPLQTFSFPPEGTCVIGSEELGVHPELLRLARKKRGIVSIPLYGHKRSLNVSVAAGIVIQRWAQLLSGR